MLDQMATDRRTWLQHALLLVGGAATGVLTPQALAKEAASAERFFSSGDFDTLSALADTLIPQTDSGGALAANVPASFDALMRGWASADTKQQVGDALARFTAAVTTAHGKPFSALPADQRKAFLTEYDRAALQNLPPPPGARSSNPFSPVISVADNGYHRIKQLMINLYYSSEIALTLETPYEHVPGEWVPSLKITPGMHAFAGTGPF